MSDAVDVRSELDSLGRVWFRGVFQPEEIDAAVNNFPNDERPGLRAGVASEFVTFLVASSLTKRIKEVWPDMSPVRFVTFDKSSTSNWNLPWHQDRVIALHEPSEAKGFTNWSRKYGIWHCEPPASFLERMLFVRIYLDAVDPSNGGMEWAVGSHRNGIVKAENVGQVAGACDTETEQAAPGDMLVLNMLTLHRSASASSDARRRVIRVDFAPDCLPDA